MDETIIDTGVLATLQAPSSSAREESDKVKTHRACIQTRNTNNCNNFDASKHNRPYYINVEEFDQSATW